MKFITYPHVTQPNLKLHFSVELPFTIQGLNGTGILTSTIMTMCAN